MASFRVDKVYYVTNQDLLVLAGALESGVVKPGWSIDLPRELKGPGWVPIHDVQQVPFANGITKTCVLLDYEVVVGAPLMEFSDLEGIAMDVKPS